MNEVTSEQPMESERRHFQRIHFPAKSTLLRNDKRWDAPLIDISLKGALVEVAQDIDLDVGTELSLEIQLGDNDERQAICFSCVSSHKEDGRLGLEINKLDIDSATHLRRLIELNIADQDAMQRELATLLEVNAKP